MTDFRPILGFGLATGAALAFVYVLVNNWRAVVEALRSARPREAASTGERRSLIFLAGPVLLLALVQGLRMVAPLGGAAVLTILLAGLLVDPAALPVLLYVLFRRATGRERGT